MEDMGTDRGLNFVYIMNTTMLFARRIVLRSHSAGLELFSIPLCLHYEAQLSIPFWSYGLGLCRAGIDKLPHCP